jgi:hypothetical protein
MQLTSIVPKHAPADDSVRLGPDDPVPMPQSPAGHLLSKYHAALFAIPGVVNTQYQPTVGDELTLLFRTEADRQIGAMILEDAVDGVRLLTKVSDWTGGSPLPDDSLWKHQAAIAAINALPGVWNSITWSGGWEGNGTAQFHTVNQAVIDRLDPLIRNQIVGQRRADGTTRMYDVEWRVLVPS